MNINAIIVYTNVGAHAEKMTTDIETEYGRLDLQGETLVRTRHGQTQFKIPVDDIRVIGEFTNDQGPGLDDWFLTIITKDDWYEIPMELAVVNNEQFLTDLGHKLQTTLNIRLANSADWKTRIIYPDNLADEELYEFKDLEPKTFWEKMQRLIGIKKTVREFSIETKKIIEK